KRRIFMVAVDIERLDLLPEFRFVNRLVWIRALTDAAVALEIFSKLSRRRAERRTLAAGVELQVDIPLFVRQVRKRSAAGESAAASAPPAVQIWVTIGHARGRRVVGCLRCASAPLRSRRRHKRCDDSGCDDEATD